eukprot:SM000144S00666  [mRNA]  locus=s144:97729:103217:+ [translate_table: standard]
MAAGLKGHAAKPRGGPRATVAVVATLLTIGFFFFFSSSQPKDKVAPQDVFDKGSTGIPSSSVTTDEAIGKTKSLAEEEVSEEEEAAELVVAERQDEVPRSQQDAGRAVHAWAADWNRDHTLIDSLKCSSEGCGQPWSKGPQGVAGWKAGGQKPIKVNAQTQQMLPSEKWVVLTYHKDPKAITRANLTSWISAGWSLVIVVDRKEDLRRFRRCRKRCRVVDRVSSLEFGFKIASKVWSKTARKMIGTLVAIREGAKAIYQTEDEGHSVHNPHLNWIKPMHIHGAFAVHDEIEGLVNPFAYFGQDRLFPRGFPIEVGKKVMAGDFEEPEYKTNVKFSTFSPIQQGVTDGEPDLDPFCRMEQVKGAEAGGVLFRKCQLPLVIPEGGLAPFNTRHTIYYQPAFFLLFVPTTVGTGVADIWAGYWGQRLLWEMGGQLTFIHTGEYHKTAHPITHDSVDAQQLQAQAQELVDYLQAWDCKLDHMYDCALELGRQMALKGFWGFEDALLLRDWLEDVASLGHVPPMVHQDAAKEHRITLPEEISFPYQIKSTPLACGVNSQHWTIVKERFVNVRPDKLCYPGNEAPPWVVTLNSTALGLLSEPQRPRARVLQAELPARFVYLVQAPGALPKLLKDVVCHGESEALLLTYKEEVYDAIWAPGTTWAEGRNILFSAALQLEQLRGWRYTYYVFVDDDLTGTGSWRSFEEFLVKQQPALAEAATASACRKLARVKDTFAAAYHLQGLLNAYHYEAAPQLLPYSTAFDSSSWQLAQAIQTHRCSLLYTGHCMRYYGLQVCGRESRPYPRGYRRLTPAEEALKAAVRAAGNESENVLSCFKPLRQVMRMGGDRYEALPKQGSYASTDFRNAPRC